MIRYYIDVVRFSTVAPEFKTKFHTKMVRKDEDVKLTCEVKGDQPIQIQWHKDKLPLLGLASTENAGLAVAKVRDVPITDGTKSELTLSRVGRKDSALYSCVATNKYGTDDTNIQLVVQGKQRLTTLVWFHSRQRPSKL